MRRWDRLRDSYIEEYRARGVRPQLVAYAEARLHWWGAVTGNRSNRRHPHKTAFSHDNAGKLDQRRDLDVSLSRGNLVDKLEVSP
jgi:hypothetical protein